MVREAQTTSNVDQHEAWLDHGNCRFFAAGPGQSPAILSPVLHLINGIYSRYGRDAFHVLRQRILTNYQISAVENAVVKVAAKRTLCVTDRNASVNWPGSLTNVSRCGLDDENTAERAGSVGFVGSDENALERCRELASEIVVTPHRYESPRRIAALLVSSDRNLLAAAVNTNATNRLRHAEVNLLLDFWRRNQALIPTGSTLYTTLSPCRMCARLLIDLAADGEQIRVVSAMRDSGTLGRHDWLRRLEICDLNAAGNEQSRPPE